MKFKDLTTPIRRNFPFLVASLFFISLLSISLYYISYKRGEWEKDIRANLLEILIGKKSNLEKALSSRIYYTKGVAAYVSVNPDLSTSDFDQLAKELIKQDSIISSMAIAPNCVISAIYPYKGHEEAVGLDLLAHPARREIVEQTIKTQRTFVAGPVELVEGGIAFISYTPIFNKLPESNGQFWGMTDIVIYKDVLLKEAAFNTTENGFKYALKGQDGKGHAGDVFWGDEAVFTQNPVTISVDLPDGEWILGASPQTGWNSYLDQDRTLSILLIISSIVISFLFWLVIRSQQQIRTNANELKAIFNSMRNLIVEFDQDGNYIKIAPTNTDLLVKPEHELLGKNLRDVLEPAVAQLSLDAISQCIQTRKLIIIEYPLVINGKNFWFTGRLSYKKGGTVILSAYDITDKKQDEEKLHLSAEKLKQLNATKDKFFSIIAHDLRSPLASFQSILELLHTDYESISDDSKKQLIKAIYESSSHLNNLLENLLEWSLSQKNELQLNLQKHNICNLAEEALKAMQPGSIKKSISISNQISQQTFALCDQRATHTILRNLVSNALKFTNQGGKITVNSQQKQINNRTYWIISIKDSGIGIPSNKLLQLFQLDAQNSTAGTNDEKGSGLGLILCQELVEKQHGSIWIESEEGQGTTVSFSLPAFT